MSYLGWLAILICALAGGTLFFSVNAIALRIFSRAKLQEAFKELNKENLIDSLTENTEKLFLACSIYRLVSNVCLLMLLLAMFLDIKGDDRQFSDYLITFVLAAILFSIFSLAVPHAWAKYAGEKILSRTYRLLMFFAIIVAPLLYVFNIYDHFVRRLAGVADATLEQQHDEKQEEFLTDLEQHRVEGVVDEEEQEMIENVLELSDTAAAEIMTPRTDIEGVNSSTGLEKIVEAIRTAGHTRVPVYEENIDNIIGFIYAKDLLTEIGKDTKDFKLKEKLREAYFVPETKPLRALLHEFQNQKLHIAVVLDEYGGTAGIVTLEDILEELVGEITDEYEEMEPEPIKQIDENTFDVDARTYIDDINDQLELELPEDEDYDTIGGFVFSHLGCIPKTGVKFDYQNLQFTISSAETRRIKRIRIQKTA